MGDLFLGTKLWNYFKTKGARSTLILLQTHFIDTHTHTLHFYSFPFLLWVVVYVCIWILICYSRTLYENLEKDLKMASWSKQVFGHLFVCFSLNRSCLRKFWEGCHCYTWCYYFKAKQSQCTFSSTKFFDIIFLPQHKSLPTPFIILTLFLLKSFKTPEESSIYREIFPLYT